MYDRLMRGPQKLCKPGIHQLDIAGVVDPQRGPRDVSVEIHLSRGALVGSVGLRKDALYRNVSKYVQLFNPIWREERRSD